GGARSTATAAAPATGTNNSRKGSEENGNEGGSVCHGPESPRRGARVGRHHDCGLRVARERPTELESRGRVGARRGKSGQRGAPRRRPGADRAAHRGHG